MLDLEKDKVLTPYNEFVSYLTKNEVCLTWKREAAAGRWM
jgi:hypothetical protein